MNHCDITIVLLEVLIGITNASREVRWTSDDYLAVEEDLLTGAYTVERSDIFDSLLQPPAGLTKSEAGVFDSMSDCGYHSSYSVCVFGFVAVLSLGLTIFKLHFHLCPRLLEIVELWN